LNIRLYFEDKNDMTRSIVNPSPPKLLALLWFAVALLIGLMAQAPQARARSIELLNVSYDPTREFYVQYNAAFAKYWKQKTGDDVVVRQSHGGSGKQSRAVIDGLDADVVTLALAADIDAIAERGGRLPVNWQSRLPYNASPYTSTIVFLVRKGNPKKIRDWGDLTRPGISVITPNPKTSGGARWNYLAAYAAGLKYNGNNEAKARAFVKALYNHVPVLDTGARGALTTFAERGVGDVLLAWENEAYLAANKLGKGQFEIITPSISILAEPPVSIVDKVTARKGTTLVAKAYLDYLYSPQAQDIIAQNYYRPVDPKTAQLYAQRFTKMQLVTIRDFGGWKKVQADHFSAGGLFDQIMRK
jgi:sulfate/thiosulfate transport system substrate-binding protein